MDCRAEQNLVVLEAGPDAEMLSCMVCYEDFAPLLQVRSAGCAQHTAPMCPQCAFVLAGRSGEARKCPLCRTAIQTLVNADGAVFNLEEHRAPTPDPLTGSDAAAGIDAPPPPADEGAQAGPQAAAAEAEREADRARAQEANARLARHLRDSERMQRAEQLRRQEVQQHTRDSNQTAVRRKLLELESVPVLTPEFPEGAMANHLVNVFRLWENHASVNRHAIGIREELRRWLRVYNYHRYRNRRPTAASHNSYRYASAPGRLTRAHGSPTCFAMV